MIRKQGAQYSGFSEEHLRNLARVGGGPKTYRPIGVADGTRSAVRYLQSDVDAWMRREPTTRWSCRCPTLIESYSLGRRFSSADICTGSSISGPSCCW